MPSRFPLKQMTLGKPAAAVASIDWRIFPRHSSQFSLRLSPLGMLWLGVIVPTRLYFLSVSNVSGPTRSMPFRPMFCAVCANCSIDIFLKHHWQTDCGSLPLRTASASGPAAACVGLFCAKAAPPRVNAAAPPAAEAISPRREMGLPPPLLSWSMLFMGSAPCSYALDLRLGPIVPVVRRRVKSALRR